MPPNHAAHGEDLYALLQIPKTASEAEIKKAYRKLALCYHPDRQTSATDQDRQEAQQKFAKLSAAYEILSDPVERKHYDDNEADRKSLAANRHGRPAPSPSSKPQDSTNAMPKSTSASTSGKKKQTATKTISSLAPKKAPSSTVNPAVSKAVPTTKSLPVGGKKTPQSTKPTTGKTTSRETSKSTIQSPRQNSAQPSTFSWSRHPPNKPPLGKTGKPPKKHAPRSTSATPHSSQPSKPTDRELPVNASNSKSDKKSVSANHSKKGSSKGNAGSGSFFGLFATKK